MQLIKKNKSKVISLLLAMMVLLSVPVSAAQASSCSHSFYQSNGFQAPTYAKCGAISGCQIISVYDISEYKCRNCGTTTTTQKLNRVYHTKC